MNFVYEVIQTLLFMSDYRKLSRSEKRNVDALIHELDFAVLPLDELKYIRRSHCESIYRHNMGNGLILMFEKTPIKLTLMRVTDVLDLDEYSVKSFDNTEG
jgi:hypothetical protein